MVDQKGHRFEILGFPTNNFGLQEPAPNSKILDCVKHINPGNGYVPNFPMFQKADCNGANEQPHFTYLKSCCPSINDVVGDRTRMYWNPVKNSDIRWNFEKFLVDPEGKAVKRFSSYVTPEDLESVIDDFIMNWTPTTRDHTSGARSSRDSGLLSWLN
ncbi:glutathione peroxidase 3-like [Branchiostoma lanceolatum]|uniref:glutathione peroxidase 3-like n=1 Tax=Branchiostoma lanceolatum TaxID=7740 RepID=UPI001132FDB1